MRDVPCNVRCRKNFFRYNKVSIEGDERKKNTKQKVLSYNLIDIFSLSVSLNVRSLSDSNFSGVRIAGSFSSQLKVCC